MGRVLILSIGSPHVHLTKTGPAGLVAPVRSEAIESGLTGPIVAVDDHDGGGVRILIE